jgi:calcineurin-like phosphoesterase family protein
MKTLEFKDRNKLYFTSDLHLGHEGIMYHCNRPFKTVEDMDKTIVDNWNNTISKDDTVFIMGDFCWRMGSQSIAWYVDRLLGNKILILGNHDRGKLPSSLTVYDGFINIKVVDPDGIDGTEKGYQRITLCHYPMLSWYQSHRGAWQLFGHWHNATVTDKTLKDRREEFEIKAYVKEEYLFMNRLRKNQYDVGVDGNNFTPIPYSEIRRIITKNLELSK